MPHTDLIPDPVSVMNGPRGASGNAVQQPGDDDKMHEECGVFGVWNMPDAAAVTALGLHALQHRGQEATGITTFDGHRFHNHKGLGLVGRQFLRRPDHRRPARRQRHRP